VNSGQKGTPLDGQSTHPVPAFPFLSPPPPPPVVQVMVRSGRSMEESLMMLVPEAYQNHPTLSAKFPEIVHFYEYYKGQMEAWDGPALLVFRYALEQGGAES